MPKKKIYDVKPPRLTPKVEKKIKEFVAEGKTKKSRARKQARVSKPQQQIQPQFAQPQERSVRRKRPAWASISIGMLLILIIVCVYLFFKLPKADITIWPKVDTLSFQQTITADKASATVDLAGDVVPAQYFQATKTNSQDFPATGNASNEGRATGNIIIYNKYDPPTPLTLKAGTHFMSDSGKLFITFQRVVIPAAKKSGSKITPGSVQIEVQAVEGGTDYNIAPANFSVPGLKGTAYYYSIYAVSADVMSGGYSGKVKKVTADDIQQAEDTLTSQTTSDAIFSLKNQISSDYILLDNAMLSDVTDASTQTESGTVAENFNYQVSVTASALAFKKSDMEQFARNYVVSQIPEGKTLLDNSLAINYSASKIDISGGKATLNLDFSVGVYGAIDKNSLALSLLGKNLEQVQQTVDSTFGDRVSNTQTDLWPFWVRSVPKKQKAITIDLKFQ